MRERRRGGGERIRWGRGEEWRGEEGDSIGEEGRRRMKRKRGKG